MNSISVVVISLLTLSHLEGSWPFVELSYVSCHIVSSQLFTTLWLISCGIKIVWAMEYPVISLNMISGYVYTEDYHLNLWSNYSKQPSSV